MPYKDYDGNYPGGAYDKDKSITAIQNQKAVILDRMASLENEFKNAGITYGRYELTTGAYSTLLLPIDKLLTFLGTL